MKVKDHVSVHVLKDALQTTTSECVEILLVSLCIICMCAFIYACVCAFMHVCVCVSMCAYYVHASMRMHVCVCVCVCVCLSFWHEGLVSNLL